MNFAFQIDKAPIQSAAARAAADRDRIRATERAQSRRMLVALGLLMFAIAVVAFRDRQFLFESEPAQNQTTTQQAFVPQNNSSAAVSVAAMQKNTATEASSPTGAVATQQNQVATVADTPRVERHLQAPSKPTSAPARHGSVGGSAAAVTAQAAQRAPIANVTIREPEITLYPRLDQRTKIEGSVELQALVGADGTIQDLQVVRGPAVLGSAAREAVLQWKFKPYTQNGVAVETYARITVNFTIKVMDGSPKTVASVEPERVIILADNYQR